ncbi:hypothetical protein ACHAXR_006645 [Thalassiosira sp. AJA248-18]
MPSPMASPIKNVNVMESSASITAVAAVANPMRNLSDAFEMLVVDGGHASPSPSSSGEKLPMMTTVADLESRLENNSNSINGSGNVPQQSRSDNNEELDYPTESMSKSGEESNASSATKPSPTSVLGLDSGDSTTTTSATAAAAAITTLQLENGLTVASVSHPHFHLHDSLRGSLCQGLVDRVSFYSVVRDINKEALDAASVDPRGGVYNDGSGVHGKGGSGKQGGGGVVVVGKVHSVGNIAVNGVVAEDGKVHVHPNTKDERNCVLVKACVLPNGGGKDANNPNEGPSSSDLNYAAAAANVGGGNGTNNIKSSTAATTTTTSTRTASPPTLGAALLDEEWWLMSAIASRTPEEVSINQSSELLPTFYEAMGEKDCAPSSTTVSTTTGGGGVGSAASDGNNAGAEKSSSSRTQLWKPGRSWWEAKSGKNPWVEPVVHNNRWRYLWPLIHYHKFIAKCIKKLKRNGIDVKCYPSNVCLFLRQEVCNVSDHLAFMSKYDSEEWTSALSHFDGWTDHDPNVEETLRTLVASQRLMGVAETADAQSSLIRGQIDDKILKAMQTAKDEAGRDAYDYKDEHFAKKDEVASSAGGGSSQQHSYSAQDNSFGRLPNRTTAWADESHLRSAIENKKRTINDTSWSNRSEFHPHHPPPYPHQDMYGQQFEHHPPYDTSGYEYGSGYGDAMSSQYYPPPPHHHPHQQYDGYHGQYPPHPPHPPHMGYPPHHGDMPYNDPYGHPNQPYYNGGYYHHPTPDGSFHEGMVFDNSMHAQDPNYMPPSMALTPNRYQGSNLHPHGAQYPASPYWGHLNISQLPGIAPSPSIHITPSKPPRGSHPNRSFRKQRQQQYGHQQHGKGIDGKAKSLIMFPNQTNNAVGQSPASRFVMSPQDKSNPYYTSKNSQATTAVANNDVNAASSSLNQSTGQEESFVLPTIEDYSPESPSVADKTTAAGHTSLHSNTSMDLMPPSVKKMYRRDKKLSEVSENP